MKTCMDCGKKFKDIELHSKAELRKLYPIIQRLVDKEQDKGLNSVERVLYKTLDIRTTSLVRNINFNIFLV